MEVKIKKIHHDAVIPKRAHDTDAGYDLVAVWKKYDSYGNVVYGFGLAFEIPQGYAGLVFPRSSICHKDLILSNSVGVVDSGFRGEVTAKFRSSYDGLRCEAVAYNVGDRVAQLIIMPIPDIEFVEVDKLSDSDRGKDGYGSTGK